MNLDYYFCRRDNSSFGEVFCERTDNSIHKLGELMKRWDNRLTLKGLSIAEKYIKGRIEIIADLDIFRGGKLKICMPSLALTRQFSKETKLSPLKKSSRSGISVIPRQGMIVLCLSKMSRS